MNQRQRPTVRRARDYVTVLKCQSRTVLVIRQPSPFFQGDFDHVTVSNCVLRHRFDCCIPRLRRNCRFLRGCGENPLRRLPHYCAALLRRRRVQEDVSGLTGNHVSTWQTLVRDGLLAGITQKGRFIVSYPDCAGHLLVGLARRSHGQTSLYYQRIQEFQSRLKSAMITFNVSDRKPRPPGRTRIDGQTFTASPGYTITYERSRSPELRFPSATKVNGTQAAGGVFHPTSGARLYHSHDERGCRYDRQPIVSRTGYHWKCCSNSTGPSGLWKLPPSRRLPDGDTDLRRLHRRRPSETAGAEAGVLGRRWPSGHGPQCRSCGC